MVDGPLVLYEEAQSSHATLVHSYKLIALGHQHYTSGVKG